MALSAWFWVAATVAVFATYAFVAYRAVEGRITIGELLLYYQAFQRGQVTHVPSERTPGRRVEEAPQRAAEASERPSGADEVVRALTVAEPEGFIRTFVDEGPLMAQLLSEAAARGIRPEYIGKKRSPVPPRRMAHWQVRSSCSQAHCRQ